MTTATTTQPMLWTTLYVDSIDRRDWLQRVRQALSLPGVDKIIPDPESGQVRVRYNPDVITVFQLHAHLRAAGL